MTIAAKARELMTYGPLVRADLFDHPAMRANLPYTAPGLKVESISLLVDTGAAMTIIDKNVLQRLGLHPTGATVDILSTGGLVKDCIVHHAELVLQFDSGPVPITTTIVGMETGAYFPHGRFQGVLGRGTLHRARFLYNGSSGEFMIEKA